MDLQESYKRARNQVRREKEFYRHLGTYTIVNSLLISLNLFTSPGYLWFVFPLAGWGTGLAIHGLSVFIKSRKVSDWEQRKTEEYMMEYLLNDETGLPDTEHAKK